MKKIFTIGLLFVMSFFVVPFCYAQLSFYVKANGSAEVSAPSFYIGSAQDETLLINQTVDECRAFDISDTYRTFKTEELETVDFSYTPKLEFSVRARVLNTSTTTPQDLILNFGYLDNNGIAYQLASKTVLAYNDFTNYELSPILASEKPTNVKSFYYEFKKGCLECEYSISKCASGFYTKVEMTK
ncbi:MAG: hypothetical protein V1851_02900 [Patescibacteria group bacterium]